MDEEELAALISDTSSSLEPSHDEIYQTPRKRPLSSPQRREMHLDRSPLQKFEDRSFQTTQPQSQDDPTQMQRLLSSLDDESLIELVNGYGGSSARARRFIGTPEPAADLAGVPNVTLHDRVESPPSVVVSDAASVEPADVAQVPSSLPDPSGTPNVLVDEPDSAEEDLPREKFIFGDYGAYFEDKQIQQQQRDHEIKKIYQDAFNDGKEFPRIFAGCIIYVNGRTDPDRLELHKKVILYGGTFLHYLSAKKSVTHIIASNLTSKKRIEFRNYKVVKPEWIVDSIHMGRRLPWQPYALITGDHDQPKLENALDSKAGGLNSRKSDTDTLDCKHPDFLKSFFAKSRLHHLSTWKADLRAAFSKKYVEERKIQPLPKDSRIAIFHIDFDCFFATVSALSIGKYDLNKDPLAVAHGTNSSDVASCNYVARKFGVRNGMWVRSARRLCPNLICIPYNFPAYETNSSRLYETLADSNYFQMILPVSVDEAICVAYFSGSADDDTLRQKCSEIARTIRDCVHNATGGCTVSIGCAESLVLARLALKRAKPDGFSVIIDKDPRGIDDFISDFHLQDLPGIGYSIIEKIRQQVLPVDTKSLTLGLLKSKASQQLLVNKLGSKTGAKINLFLSGKDDEESLKMLHDPQGYFSRKSISVDINYAIRFDNIHEIDSFIDRICEYLVSKIQELDMVTAHIVMKVMRRSNGAPIEPAKYMGMGECDAFSKGSRLGVPTDELGIIATEMKSSFRMLNCPAKELRGIAIQFNKLEKKSTGYKQQVLPFKGIARNTESVSLINIPPLKSRLRPEAYSSLPRGLRHDVKTELVKRHIEVPDSPSPRKSTTASPVKDYWAKHTKSTTTGEVIPSSLDQDFLSCLPSQIQREIKRDHAIVKKARSSLHQGLKRKEEEVVVTPKGRLTLMEPVKFQSLDRPKEVIKLIQLWIDETADTGPNVEDLDLFERYVKRLSAAKKTHFILRLTRAISSRLEFHSSLKEKASLGRQEWEEYLLKRMIPILNKSASQEEKGFQVTFEI